MRRAALLLAAAVWVIAWLVAPAAWWLDNRILNESAFEQTMVEALQIENVDEQITAHTTAAVTDRARDFVARSAPVFQSQADYLLDRAQPTLTTVVNRAVNSQPGQRVMLGMATQTHNVLLAWLDADALGRPGFEADLDAGSARFDIDELLAGQRLSLGPLSVPLDALDLPGLSVPVPLPPDWMRAPANVLREALVPSLVAIVLSGAALVWLDGRRTRALGVAALATAAGCAAAVLLIRSAWTVSGADTADWTLTRALWSLMVQPWITSYLWVIGGLVLTATAALWWDRRTLGREPRSALD